MGLVDFKYVITEVSIKNEASKYALGIKLGDREPAIVSNHGVPLIFDTKEEAESYLADDDNF